MDWSKLLDLLKYDAESPLIFSSGMFIFLFLLFTFVYNVMKGKTTGRIIFVTLFSYYFYYKSSGIHFLLLALTTTVDYLLAHCIARTEVKSRRRLYLVLSLCVNLGMLAYFKYTNFFGGMIADIIHKPFEGFNIVLPVGISFFTFQSLSYTIDVYRGNIKPLRHWFDYAFYVSFFPQLVAGPIVRAKDFIPQIRQQLFVSREMFGRGVFLILVGLFKKAVISNYIGINFVDRVFDAPALYTGLENLFGLYGYAVQIYCDFSGYSDMAIGIALLLGFHFNTNFDAPYRSRNITEFWRRWHISLSSWLKDYLYISLGGNRKGKIRTYVNLVITMLLGGLWHGASWLFLLWGLLHGMGLVVHKIYRGLLPKRPEGFRLPRWRVALNIVFTFHFVLFGWLLFRAGSLSEVGLILQRILTAFHPEIFVGFVQGYTFVFILMVVGMMLHFVPQKLELRVQGIVVRMPIAMQALLIVVLAIVIFQVKSADVQPFIYFNF